MRRKLILGGMALMASGFSLIATPAFADRYDDGRGYYASDGRYYQGNRVYHGEHGYYRHRCDGGNGVVRTVGGGVGGALIGNALGGGLGTVLGGVGGAVAACCARLCRALFMAFTTRNSAKATIRKFSTAFRNSP